MSEQVTDQQSDSKQSKPTQLNKGDQAPGFTLTGADGQSVSLADFGGQNVVVYFYPKAGTPGCTSEACDFRDHLSSLKGAGYQVLGISPDSVPDLQAFAAEQGLNFPVLADPDAQVAKTYGAYGEKELNGKKMTGLLRSTVVVDGDGTVRQAEYNVDAKGHVARLRSELGID